VDAAARALGVTVDAIRKRVQRGTIPHERDESGRVWVLLEAASTIQDASSTVRDTDQDTTGQAGRELLEAKDETIEELRQRVRRLEQDLDARNEEIRRRDHLLAAALERIPALDAPREPRDEPETLHQDAGGVEDGGERAEPQRGAEEHSTNVERSTEETARRPSWWRRIFGG
jgi:hypothetical protein